MNALSREELEELIKEENLIQDYPHFETQIQPQGFDLTAGEIHSYEGSGKLDFSNSERKIPGSSSIRAIKKDEDDTYGWWELDPGVYKVVMNERVDIPNDLAGIAFPRSSLLRMGATVENAVWDAGYTGTGSFMLEVSNPEGIELKENARLNQIMFLRMEETGEGYSGRYHED